MNKKKANLRNIEKKISISKVLFIHIWNWGKKSGEVLFSRNAYRIE